MPESPTISLSENAAPIRRGRLFDFSDNPISCMRSLHAEFGDLAVLEEAGQRVAFVFSPEYNREVLSQSRIFHSRFFAVRGGRRSAQRRVTSGLLSMNGAEHRENRRIMMDVFSRKVLPAYHSTICQLTSNLMQDWEAGQPRDLNTEMVHFMLRMTGALLFGIDDSDYSVALGEKIDSWVRMNHQVGLGALVPSREFTDGYEQLLSMADDLESSILDMFREHRRNADAERRVDVLSLMFKAQASEQQLTDEQLVGHATLTFAAAHLTTAHTFSWTLFLLAQHPQVMQRLADELQEKVASPEPTFDELSQCSYLECVIRESMRVLPASSYSQRITTEATELGPLQLAPGTPVIFSQFMTHHRPDLFEDPDEFRPERWESITPSAYEYLPFGAGARMCIGAPLAMVELRTALAMMLRRFHFQMVAGSTVDTRVISTMLGPTTSVDAYLLPTSKLPKSAPVYGTIHELINLPDAAVATPLRRVA